MSGPTHRFVWRRRLPARADAPCRILATGALNSVLVEFADGGRVLTSRRALRRLALGQVEPPQQGQHQAVRGLARAGRLP